MDIVAGLGGRADRHDHSRSWTNIGMPFLLAIVPSMTTCGWKKFNLLADANLQ